MPKTLRTFLQKVKTNDTRPEFDQIIVCYKIKDALLGLTHNAEMVDYQEIIIQRLALFYCQGATVADTIRNPTSSLHE